MSQNIEAQNPFQLYGKGFRLYASFNGRASRKEYWSFHLLNVGVAFLLLIIGNSPEVGLTLLALLFFGSIIPGTAVLVRRLHDVGQSGWWVLIGWIPLIGNLILLIWLVSKGVNGANQYGDDPLSGTEDLATENNHSKTVNNQKSLETNQKPAETTNTRRLGEANRKFTETTKKPVDENYEYFCGDCEKQVGDEANFCKYCGASFEPAVCSTCGSGIAENSKFCESCGKQLTTDEELRSSSKRLLYIDPEAKIRIPIGKELENMDSAEQLGWWLLFEVAKEANSKVKENLLSEEESSTLRSSVKVDIELEKKVIHLAKYVAKKSASAVPTLSAVPTKELVRYPSGLIVSKIFNEKMNELISSNLDWSLLQLMKDYRHTL